MTDFGWHKAVEAVEAEIHYKAHGNEQPSRVQCHLGGL